MEKIVEQLLIGENVRVLVILVAIVCTYVLIRSQTKGLEYSLNKKMDDGFNFLDKKIDVKFGVLDKKIDDVEASLNKKIDVKFGILDRKIDVVEASLNKKIDDVEGSLLKAMDEKMDIKLAAFHAQLKANDFAHLNATIEALTFTLEKNKFLEKEDKEYIDGRLG